MEALSPNGTQNAHGENSTPGIGFGGGDLTDQCSSEWRPAYPKGAPSANCVTEDENNMKPINKPLNVWSGKMAHDNPGDIALSASGTALNLSEPSTVQGVHGLGSQSHRAGFSDSMMAGAGSGSSSSRKDGLPPAGTYASVGINQRVVQLSKSRSADFILPRQKPTSMHSQNLDVSTVPPADSSGAGLKPSPRNRFHIDQHVAVYLQGTAATRTGSPTSSSSKASSKGCSTGSQAQCCFGPNLEVSRVVGSVHKASTSQAPHVAFRRAKTVYGIQDNCTKQQDEHLLPTSAPKLLSKESQDYGFMIPSTVIFGAPDGEEDLARDNHTYKSSISPTRKGPGMELISEKSVHRAVRVPASPVSKWGGGAMTELAGSYRRRTIRASQEGDASATQGTITPMFTAGSRNKTMPNYCMRPTKSMRWNRPARR